MLCKDGIVKDRRVPRPYHVEHLLDFFFVIDSHKANEHGAYEHILLTISHHV